MVVLGTCPKCGKPYQRLGKRFEKHKANCKGKNWKGSPRKRPDMPRGERPPAVETGLTGVDAAIADLNNRRLDLERQKALVHAQVGIIDEDIKIIDKAIGTLKKSKRDKGE